MVRRGAVLGVLIAAAALVPGIAGAGGRKDRRAAKIEFSGFLENYDQLRRIDDLSEFVWGYVKAPLILRRYDNVILDPILVYFHPEAKGTGIDPAKLAELTAFFREKILEEMSDVRQVELVDRPGPDTMRVRIAITDVRSVKSGANIGAKVAGAAVGAGFLVPAVEVGGATMECEVLDSETGERLVALVDTDSGRRMMNFKSMKAMGDAKAAMAEWARDFRKNLQRIHEGRLPKAIEKGAVPPASRRD